MDTQTYLELLQRARQQSRREDEAGDLLQTALLIAIEAERGDMTRRENRRWLGGVLRNRARHEARSAVRRRQRETGFQQIRNIDGEPDAETAGVDGFVAGLPPALRTTALLALTGHTKAEIAWLLDLPDTALRKRISDIRRRWRKSGLSLPPGSGGPRGDFAFGLMRRALLRSSRAAGVELASHDPDGHLFVLSSQKAGARQRRASDI